MRWRSPWRCQRPDRGSSGSSSAISRLVHRVLAAASRQSKILLPATGMSSNGEVRVCASIRSRIPPSYSAASRERTIVDVIADIMAEQKLEADQLWFKGAIIYQLHVRAFAGNSTGGIGDFAGLTENLDYLEFLGIRTLCLLPFYPSPGRDDGYDISDYRTINPDFGTMADFRRFMQEAKRRKLRVI